MSDFDNTMSMNSLMDAIYGTNPTQQTYLSTQELQQMGHGIENITQFMESLMKYLVQLCLTQSAADNVINTLKPWIKQSGVIISKNPKKLMQSFFMDYVTLLQTQTNKINKYGSKKLNYLTKTVSKQIFTEIMRMSCDLKLESLNRNHHEKAIARRKNHLVILAGTLKRFTQKNVSSAFRAMKLQFRNNIHKQDQFIEKLTYSFNRLNSLGRKKIKCTLSKGLEMWRRKTTILALQQTKQINKIINNFSGKLIPDVITAWEDTPKLWVDQVAQKIVELFSQNFSEIEGIQIIFHTDPELFKQRQRVLALSYSDSGLNSFRSNLTGKNSLSSSLYSCMKRDQIKYDHDNNTAIIPFFVDRSLGVFIISWRQMLPMAFFQKVLRILEMVKQILEHLCNLGTRLTYYISQYEESEWQVDAFNMHTKNTLKQCKTDPQDQLNQIQKILVKAQITFLEIYHNEKSVEPCVIYGDHQTPRFQTNIYELVWQKLQKTHNFKLDRDGVKYNISKIQFGGKGFCRYLSNSIIQSTSEEQENNNSIINKEGSSLVISSVVSLILKNLGKVDCEQCLLEISDTQQLTQLNNLNTTENKLKNQNQKYFQVSDIISLKKSHSVEEIQKTIYSMLRNTYSDLKLFSKLFYCIDEDLCQFVYENKNGEINRAKLPKSITLGHMCNYNLHEKESNIDEWRNLVQILQKSSIFQSEKINPTLYIYEHEKTQPFKIIPFKIDRKAILILSTYQNPLIFEQTTTSTQIQNNFIKNINSLCDVIKNSSQIFMKKDALKWSSNILEKSVDIVFPSLEFNNDILLKSQQYTEMKQSYDIEKLIGIINMEMKIVQSSYLWKIVGNKNTLQNKLIKLAGKFNGTKQTLLPYGYLLEEPLQSHQKLSGSHRIIRRSQNYGLKLRQILTYIPKFTTNKKQLQYAQILLKKLQSKGQITDPICSQLIQFLNSTTDYNKNRHNFISIPIKLNHRKNTTLILVLAYNKLTIINQRSFHACCNYYSQIIQRIYEKKHGIMRINGLQMLDQYITPILRIRKQTQTKVVIQSFSKNYRESLMRVKKLCNKIQKSISSANYRQIRSYFKLIRGRSQKINVIYRSGCQFLYQKLRKIFFINKLLTNLQYKQNKKLGTNKIFQCTNKLCYYPSVCSKMNIFSSFKQIKYHSQYNHTNKQIKKAESIKKINQITLKIKRRNQKQWYRINYRIYQAMIRDLKLIEQEFIIMGLKGIRGCVQFLNTRLGIVLNQYYAKRINLDIQYQFGDKNNSTNTIKILAQGIIQTDLIDIEGTGFIVKIKKQKQQQNQIVLSEYFTEQQRKVIKQILFRILPIWQISLRKHLQYNIKILSDSLEGIIHQSLAHLYLAHSATKNKQHKKHLSQIRENVTQIKNQMQIMKNNTIDINTGISLHSTITKRQNHKKQTNQLENNLKIAQNQGRKLEIDLKIKKKTNAMYRFQNILTNRKAGIKNREKQNCSITNNTDEYKDMKEQMETIKANIFCIRKLQTMKILPLWLKQVQKIISRRRKEKLYEALQLVVNHMCQQ